MNWIEVNARFERLPEDWSPLVEVMRRHGCENTLQTDRPPTLTACISDVDGSDAVLATLVRDLEEAGAQSVDTREVPDQDWHELWRAFFHVRRIGSYFVIRPTWEAYDLEPGDLVIVLDPGQAFGTGDHQTTRLMLESMELGGMLGKRVCDVGCGSGVLSIAAHLLGAAEVVAVDIDSISVAVTRENCELNDVQIEVLTGEGIEALDVASGGGARRWDVVLSNIISATLITMAHEVAARLEPDGLWIVSGIISENWTDVRAAAEREGLELVRRSEEEGWVAATFRRV